MPFSMKNQAKQDNNSRIFNSRKSNHFHPKITLFITKLHCIPYKSYTKGVRVGFAKTLSTSMVFIVKPLNKTVYFWLLTSYS